MSALPSGTVTLLFTDIEGSTQLLRRLGNAYADVLAAHQRLLRAAFTQYGGREVDTQGDAFFVAFPRAADAVGAAVDAQRALAAHPWPEGAAVRVRMGLHTGEPTATGERYVGLAVHRAARVGSAGHGGQVLLSTATEAVLRDELPRDLGLKDLGEHRLKDFDQPERLYQVVAPGLPTDFPPLKVADPAPLPPLPVPLAVEDTPLVGRERELALLRERLGAALARRGGLVLLGGEAGVGKTTLAEALAREALGRGARVAVGRCYDLTETPPYGPWREALAAIPTAPDLPPLPGALGGPERGEAVASQGALFALTHAFLAAATALRPLVLLLDDLHWADPASLELLRSLARQVAGLPLLLLATYRADELTRRHPLSQLLPLLVREARAAQLDLHALPDEAVRNLVRARYALSEADEQRLAAYLRERAEGHPLFVGELLRTLEAESALHPADGGWSLGDLGGVRVPRLLRQVIEGRLDRLGERDQRLLAVAAVIGQDLRLDVWAAVAEADEEALLDLLERAAATRLVEPTAEGLRFAHALIREALYEGTLPLRRRALHRRAAEALLADARPDPDAVAYHLREAGDRRAVEWLIQAGERAQRAYAWLTAAERLEAALALAEAGGADPRERALLLVRLGRLRRYADPRHAVAAFEEAARLLATAGDRALASYVGCDLGMLRCFAGDIRQGLAELAAAVAAVEALPAAERARVRAWAARSGDEPDADYRGTLALWLANAGRYAEAQALGERVAAGAPDPAAARGRGGSGAADGYLGLAAAHALLGRPAEARRAFGRARELYRAVEHHALVAVTALIELALAALPYQADDLAGRQRLAAEAEAARRRAGGALLDDDPRRVRLPLLAVEGEWAEVRRLALALRASSPVLPGVAALSLGGVARAQGDAALAWALVREALPAGPATEPGDSRFDWAAPLQHLAAALALDAGDLAAARAWLACHERWLAWSGAVLGRAEGQLGWAAYHRAAGDLAVARQHAERALAQATEPRQPLALLAAHRALGELATEAWRHTEAQDHLDQALALAEACAAPYERALTLLALAELRAGTGDRDGARALLGEVRAICAPLGAKLALARAAALAARLDEGKP